ncbi:hypothetical protein SPI_08373 [Niveomyces insectorum RCEF 264]|uniref:Uncharacterized protein n=1 Tax=Niveomyces insectorum RCEF 264 TaxID=1081102 RepID=A0A167N940_9HYPO|nr:hypothetical protein SPI_08373 [Niveomyces insectorum RCEF 264]
MAKRARARLSRPTAVSPTPTAVPSGYTTPSGFSCSSAYPSDDEMDVQPAKFDINTIPLHKLSLQETAAPAKPPQPLGSGAAKPAAQDPAKADEPTKPFRFLDLPSELRIKVYKYHFEGTDPVLDLTPENTKKVHRKLALLRTCRTLYIEASHFFYSSRVFRVFPTYPGRFFKTKRPLLARLTARQRAAMTGLELRLGPGFNKPPSSWAVNKRLGLKDCVNVRKLSVFVQIDPSVSWLDGFRKQGFYEAFSRALLDDVLKATPSIEVVEFDGYDSVRKDCPIMEALVQATTNHRKRIVWSTRSSWKGTDDSRTHVAATLANYDVPIVAVA